MKIIGELFNTFSNIISSFNLSKSTDTVKNDQSLETSRHKIKYQKKRYEQMLRRIMDRILDDSDFYEDNKFHQKVYKNVLDKMKAVYNETLSQKKGLEKLIDNISHQEKEEINNQSTFLTKLEVYEQIRKEEEKINDILQKINYVFKLSQFIKTSISKKIKKTIYKKVTIPNNQSPLTKKSSLQGA